MKWLCGIVVFLAVSLAPARAATKVLVQDYEKADSLPKVWVVNIPNENAATSLATEHPYAGKQSLKLHYHFDGKLPGEYLGVPSTVDIEAPIHTLRFMLYGDNSQSTYGVQLTDAGGETHQYKAGIIDFKGWKEMSIALDPAHETWGGDKNGKLDYPLTGITYIIGQPADKPKFQVESDLYFDDLSVDSEKAADQTLGGHLVSVVSPAYCSEVNGNTRIVIAAEGFKTATARSWKPGGQFGTDSVVAKLNLDAQGNGSFVFPANQYPHGPITVTITGENGAMHDNCYLQLYNKGGVSWSEGIPKDPPAAAGMALLFADDFKGPLSISSTDPKATYYDHKPPNGSQDFSSLPFSGYDSPRNPFSQVDTYLRIRADAKKNSAGILSSLKNDASGIKASLPCYFECRFIGPNAIGTWPAFWLLSDYMMPRKNGVDEKTIPVDELDIIEAYGGEGPHHPNAHDLYMVTPHAWNQGDAGKTAETAAFKAMHNPISMKKFGIPSTWYEALHTYGCKITATDTIYYCDNIEVGRHATLDTSKKYPFFFLINLATGGGWPVDLSRYNGLADMYVDYVRVYQGKP